MASAAKFTPCPSCNRWLLLAVILQALPGDIAGQSFEVGVKGSFPPSASSTSASARPLTQDMTRSGLLRAEVLADAKPHKQNSSRQAARTRRWPYARRPALPRRLLLDRQEERSLLGVQMRTPGTIQGWIQEEGSCKPRDQTVDRVPLTDLPKESADVEECAKECLDSKGCASFSVLGPGTQTPAKCTFYKVGFTGNLEAGYLCYVHEEKAKAANFDVGESIQDKPKEQTHGPPGPPGQPGSNGKDVPPVKMMLPSLGAVFVINLLLTAFLFDYAKKEFLATLKPSSSRAEPSEEKIPEDENMPEGVEGEAEPEEPEAEGEGAPPAAQQPG